MEMYVLKYGRGEWWAAVQPDAKVHIEHRDGRDDIRVHVKRKDILCHGAMNNSPREGYDVAFLMHPTDVELVKVREVIEYELID